MNGGSHNFVPHSARRYRKRERRLFFSFQTTDSPFLFSILGVTFDRLRLFSVATVGAVFTIDTVPHEHSIRGRVEDVRALKFTMFYFLLRGNPRRRERFLGSAFKSTLTRGSSCLRRGLAWTHCSRRPVLLRNLGMLLGKSFFTFLHVYRLQSKSSKKAWLHPGNALVQKEH